MYNLGVWAMVVGMALIFTAIGLRILGVSTEASAPVVIAGVGGFAGGFILLLIDLGGSVRWPPKV